MLEYQITDLSYEYKFVLSTVLGEARNGTIGTNDLNTLTNTGIYSTGKITIGSSDYYGIMFVFKTSNGWLF